MTINTDPTETNPDIANLHAALNALSRRVSDAASHAARADNTSELAALKAELTALITGLQQQIDALAAQVAAQNRTFAQFNEAERYAITRSMVARIMAEEHTRETAP